MRFNISIKYYTSMKNIIYISKIFPAKRKSYQTNQTLKCKYGNGNNNNNICV